VRYGLDIEIQFWFILIQGFKNFPKIEEGSQTFRRQNGVSRHVPYWVPKSLGSNMQNLKATTTL